MLMRAKTLLFATAAMLLAGASIPASAHDAKTQRVSQNAADYALSAEPLAPLEPRTALAAQAKLAFGLVRRLEQAKNATENNIVVSPASLAAVLALLELGADDRMRTAVHRTLGFDRRSVRSAADHLDGLRTTIGRLTGADGESGPLTVANTLVFDPASAPYRLALMGLRATGADVRVEDLSKPDTVQRINEWVAARTKGLIPTILDDAPRDGGLVALNALHFKDRWRIPFDPDATGPAPFRMLDGRTIEVPMMHHYEPGKFLFRQGERFVAIDLPYASEDFSMVVATTKDKPARARDFTRVATWLGGDGFSESEGELALPRFSLSGNAELVGALDTLDLRRSRMSPTALRGLSPVPQTIARVIQKTELRVDEAGTEAAAATAVETMRSMPAEYVKMVVDKPFVFALRDRRTGLILMSGYVGRPSFGGATAEAAQ
jgi:serine protease inhibitor